MQSPEQDLLLAVEQALAKQDMRPAIAACRELNTCYPDFVPGWRIAGDIHTRMQKPEALLFSSSQVLRLEPGDPVGSLQRIDALVATDDIEAARDALHSLADTDLGSVDLHDAAGRHMAGLDMHEEALVQYRKALQLDPDNPALLYNLATAQRFTGDIDGAIESLDAALALDPGDFEANAMRSSLRKVTPDRNHIDQLLEALSGPDLPDGAETSLCYALAKEYDDLDDTEKSFSYLKRGADERRSRMKYTVETDLQIIERIKAAFDTEFMETAVQGASSDEPIFVIGLPRTGTTLVERILASHSNVYAAGELDNFGRELVAAVGEPGSGDVIAASRSVDMRALGDDYVAGTRPLTGHTPRFIDKLPFNYLYAGLIHKALPAARIINLVRHPMASGYAIYKQLFRDPYPFSYDLEDLGHYYVAWRSLMDHWHNVMPGVIFDVAYEDVVNDLETEARRLVSHCGLEWEDKCLTFYENQQASTTASAAQVRQPVYTRSLERWKLYRESLTPFENILNAAGITTD